MLWVLPNIFLTHHPYVLYGGVMLHEYHKCMRSYAPGNIRTVVSSKYNFVDKPFFVAVLLYSGCHLLLLFIVVLILRRI